MFTSQFRFRATGNVKQNLNRTHYLQKLVAVTLCAGAQDSLSVTDSSNSIYNTNSIGIYCYSTLDVLPTGSCLLRVNLS